MDRAPGKSFRHSYLPGPSGLGMANKPVIKSAEET